MGIRTGLGVFMENGSIRSDNKKRVSNRYLPVNVYCVTRLAFAF